MKKFDQVNSVTSLNMGSTCNEDTNPLSDATNSTKIPLKKSRKTTLAPISNKNEGKNTMRYSNISNLKNANKDLLLSKTNSNSVLETTEKPGKKQPDKNMITFHDWSAKDVGLRSSRSMM